MHTIRLMTTALLRRVAAWLDPQPMQTALALPAVVPPSVVSPAPTLDIVTTTIGLIQLREALNHRCAKPEIPQA